MVTNAPRGAKAYGDMKWAEGAGDRQGAGGSSKGDMQGKL